MSTTDLATRFPLLMRALVVTGWILGLLVATKALWLGAVGGNLGIDAHAYWMSGRVERLYGHAPGELDAFLYSPAFAQLIRPLTMLSWPIFLAVWIGLESGTLLWLVRPLQWRLAVPVFLLCMPELIIGNVYLLLAAMIVIGFRWPGAWTGALLTKVTPGVGLLWFCFRREWLSLLKGLTIVSGVVAVSYLMEPDAWRHWFAFLLAHREGSRDGSLGLIARCTISVAVTAFGAISNRRWTLPLAVGLASPVFAVPTLSVLAAVPRLVMAPAETSSLHRGLAQQRAASTT